MVRISGQIVEESGSYFLAREGGSQKLLLDPVIQAIGLESQYENYTLTWEGRLIQVDDDVNMAQTFQLSDADIIDTDTNGIPDELE